MSEPVTWEEQRLFDAPATHRPAPMGKVKVTVRAYMVVEIDLDDDGWFEEANDWLLRNGSTAIERDELQYPTSVEYALEAVAISRAEDGLEDDVEISGAAGFSFGGFRSISECADAFRTPRWIPIEDERS